MRPTADKSVRRTKVISCLVLGVISAATWLPRAGGPIDLRWDGGAYYSLGTSLAEGKGYRLSSEPGSIRTTLHPPLLPAFVAAHQIVLRTSDPVVVGRALRLSMSLFSIAYVIAIYLLLSAYIPSPYALAAAALAVFQPQYTYFSDALYAETFFGLFTLLFFIFYQCRRDRVYFLLSGLCAVLAYEARTAGIVLLGAWIGDNLLRRDFRRAGVALAVCLVASLGWMGWIAAVESSSEYQRPAYAYQRAPYVYFNVSYAKNILTMVDPFKPEAGPLTGRAFLARMHANLESLPSSIGQATSSWEAPAYVSLPLAFLVVGGLLLLAARKQAIVPLYIGLSLAIICATPFQRQFVRYLLPLYPLFALAMFQLLDFMAQEVFPGVLGLPARAGRVLIWLVVCVIAIQELNGLHDMYGLRHHDVAYRQGGVNINYRLFYYQPFGRAFDEALDWLQGRAQPTDVIAATDPQWAYLRTGRKAVVPPFELNAKKAQQLIDTVPVRYLIAETTPQKSGMGAYYRYMSTLIRENPESWNRLWESSDGSIEIYERTNMGYRAVAK